MVVSRLRCRIGRPHPQLSGPRDPRPPVPPPSADAPKVICSCGCTAIEWQICGDGCHGVVNQSDGRCQACIDPSVIIDWSKDGVENECANCGAPMFSSRTYCTTGCEEADA